MLTHTQQTLLSLLRMALSQSKGFPWMSDVDLKSVIDLAEAQGVSYVACDGLKKLYEKAESDEVIAQSLSPLKSVKSESLELSWLGKTMKAERIYKHYVQDLLKLVDFFSSNGIRTMVLKGYGLSLNYPIPAHRPIGDIDVYLLGEADSADKMLKNQLGIHFIPNEPNHSVFPFGNCMVENHRYILNIYKIPSNRRLEVLLEKLAEEANAYAEEGRIIYLPSVNFNSVHLLRHMASDFATITTSLRHVLDWCTFVHAHADEMDWGFLRKVAHELNMHRFLNALNSICVDYFGCPSEEFPVEELDDVLRDRILSEVLNPAFKEKIPSRKISLSYGWVKIKRMWRNRWKYQLVFSDSFCQLFYCSLKNRIFKSIYALRNSSFS